jgi:transcription elongation factor B subunit 1
VNNVDGQPQSEWVRLQSSDGFSYLVKRTVAEASGTVRNMLDSTGFYLYSNPHFSGFLDFESCQAVMQKLKVEYVTFVRGAHRLIMLFNMCFLILFFYRGIVVEKLVEYMSFKAHYESVGSKEEIPVNDFMERIPPEIVLELSVLDLPLNFFLLMNLFVLGF